MSYSINRSFLLALAATITIAGPAVARDKAAGSAPKINPGGWFTDNDYPPAAKRAREQGRVQIELSVDDQGMATACRIVASSGSAELDATTCRLAQQRGRFTPATDRDGKRIASVYSLSTRWVLDNPKPLVAPRRSAGVLEIDQAGKAVSCRDDSSEGSAVWMQYRCELIDKMPRSLGIFARGGSGALGTVEVTFEQSWAFDGQPQPAMAYEKPGQLTVGLVILHFDVDTNGRVQNCTVIESKGWRTDVDPCAQLPTQFEPPEIPRSVTYRHALSRADK